MTTHSLARNLLLALAILEGCGPARAPVPAHDAAAHTEIIAALDRYMVAARAVDADRIAASFAAGGTLFEPGIFPIQSADSIREFVASFPGVQVESASVSIDTIEVFGNAAYLWGAYYEKLAFPGQPQSVQEGRLVIQWVRPQDGGWLIQRYFRVPVPSPPSAPPGSARD